MFFLKRPVWWSTQIGSITKLLWFDGEQVTHKPILSFTFVYLWSQMTKLREFYRSAVFFNDFVGFLSGNGSVERTLEWSGICGTAVWGAVCVMRCFFRRCTKCTKVMCRKPIFVWWFTKTDGSVLYWVPQKVVQTFVDRLRRLWWSMMIDDSGYYNDDFDSNLVCEDSKILFDAY